MPKLDDKRTTPYFYRLFAPGAGAGPGIDPKDRERVFQAFYTTKLSGVGMGLSICRSIIEAHGGRLWADANEPRGAVFQFTLSNAETHEFSSGSSPECRAARRDIINWLAKVINNSILQSVNRQADSAGRGAKLAFELDGQTAERAPRARRPRENLCHFVAMHFVA
jgi:hypothetical protein